jgi:Skp family chaperone for outer membrane proteins
MHSQLKLSDIMTRLTMRYSFILLAAIGLVFTVPAMAQNNGDTQTIAVMDMQALLQNSTAADSIQSQLNAKRDEFQQTIQAEEAELQSAEEELSRQQSVLSEEEFAKKRQEFQRQVAEFQRTVQQRRQQLDQAYANALTKLRNDILELTADVSEEDGIDIVLSRQQVVIADKDIDITDMVMTRLNETVTEIDVTIPKPDNG